MNPVLPTFLLTLIAFVLLALATFSVPFPTGFCLLQADVLRDTIRFGIWGYCFQDSGVCSPKGLGYQWDPEIIVWMTKVLVLIPVAAIFTLLLLISIVPATLCHRSRDTIFPPPFYSLLAIPAALTSLLGFVFLITLSTIATARFHDAGLYAVYGSLPWMSLAATVILLFLMFYTGCGATWRGPFGEMSPHIRNRWSAVYAY